jgi:signal transduction histidine kinase
MIARQRRKLSPADAEVNLDRRKFTQVLHNLESNSVKFTNEGGEVRVTAELEALTRKIVELQRGTIGVLSVLGRGTTFTMTYPMSHERPVRPRDG